MRGTLVLSAMILAIVGAILIGCGVDDQEPTGQSPATDESVVEGADRQEKREVADEAELPRAKQLFDRTGLDTDLTEHSVDLDQLIGGGPPKDGIPALTKPAYVSPAEAPEGDDIRGILVDFEGEQRFYPFNIMVWHEVVNDSIAGVHYAVTFCPLCGSGMVFDRNVDTEVVEFGVSGLLWESNLVMFDRGTESLWSQTLGEAVVGPFTGTRLELLPMQLLTMEQVREAYPDAQVLSRETGHRRDYESNPYGDYDESERLIFPVGDEDDRYFSKELFWAFWVGETSVAFPMDRLGDTSRSTTIEGREVVARRDGGSIEVAVDGEPVPGYVEMWFSWISTHSEDGVVWNMD